MKYDPKLSLEENYLRMIRRQQLPEPEVQLRFAKDDFGRQWRFDVAWTAFKLAVEINGFATETHGDKKIVVFGHGTPDQVVKDYDKGNAAILLGWDVLRFAYSHIRSGVCVAVTIRTLTLKGWNGERSKITTDSTA